MSRDDDEEPLPFLELADRLVAEKRLQRRPDQWRAVKAVFEDADPNTRFIEFARAYIGKPGKDVRAADINDLQWAFGVADRPALKRLLRWKSIVGGND